MKFRKKGSSLSLVVISVIAGLIIGIVVGPSLTNLVPGIQTTASQATLDLRSNLKAAQRENVALVMAVSRRAFDNDPYTTDAVKALDDNAQDLGDILADVYGQNVGQQYTSLWRIQDTDFINYTNALKNGDSIGKNKASADLDSYSDTVVAFWAKVNPSFDSKTYQAMVKERVRLIRAAIDAYAVRDVGTSYKQQHAAFLQIGKAGDLVVNSIVKQFPNKYK